MQFTIEKEDLKTALAQVSGIVEQRNTLPVLNNVLLTVHDGSLEVKASDLDAEAVTTAPANTVKLGALTVNAKILSDIAKKVVGDEIAFALDVGGSILRVKSGKSKFDLPILPAEDFPDFGEHRFQHGMEIEGEALKRLFTKTAHARSTEETRYYLNGTYLHEVDGKLRAVTTDGHRLAQVEMECAAAAGMPGIIIPRKVADEISKLLKAVPVKIETSENRIRFSVGSTVVTSKLVDGSFPDYQRAFSVASNKLRLIVDSEAMAKSADRISMLISDKTGVKITLGRDTVNLSTSITGSKNGSAEDEIQAQYDGQQFEIGYQCRYLQDVLGEIKGEALFLFRDASSPAVATSSTDDSALYVLMPMRV